MDLTSLYYFQELSKDLNMTKTAERLYISQQTLSNHIQRLEQYYGTKLFYRKPSLSLTCAGEFVLSFAQVMGKEERNLKDILSDIEHQERGVLRVGASMVRSIQFLPRILPEFHRRYPKVSVLYEEGRAFQLEKRVLEGELDFAIAFSRQYHPDLVDHEFLQDPVYLCIPETLFQEYYAPEEIQEIKERSIHGVDFRDFARLPFSLMATRLGRMIRECFNQAGVEPNVFFTAPSSSQIMPLCAMGATACYCTQLALLDHWDELAGKVNIFPIMEGGRPLTQSLSLLRHRQRYLTHFSKSFMELLFDAASSLEQIPVLHVVRESAPAEPV